MIETVDWPDLPPESLQQGAVAIGNFDGVHAGHALLVRELFRQARTVGGPAVVLTFDPHPLLLLRPSEFLPVLTTVADRVDLLRQRGADHVCVLRTTPELLQLTAERFFEEMIRSRLRAKAMVEGENFGFGRERTGNIASLTEMCRTAGVGLTVVPPLQRDGRTISSSRVREALDRGDVRQAASLLDRPYRLRGMVGRGAQRGQKLGFPTANLIEPASLVPAVGVYAVRAQADGKNWPGAANIGPNPTFGEQERKVETHLIGFEGDLLGRPIALDFIDRLRDTRTFPSVDELVQQISKDVEQARLAGDPP